MIRGFSLILRRRLSERPSAAVVGFDSQVADERHSSITYGSCEQCGPHLGVRVRSSEPLSNSRGIGRRSR